MLFCFEFLFALFRVDIPDKDCRVKILSSANKLKNSTEFKKVYISKDLTFLQRQEIKERRARSQSDHPVHRSNSAIANGAHTPSGGGRTSESLVHRTPLMNAAPNLNQDSPAADVAQGAALLGFSASGSPVTSSRDILSEEQNARNRPTTRSNTNRGRSTPGGFS